MKAERRHELKTNSLARKLEGFPAFLKQHANRLMVGLILILLVILALQYRARTNAEAAQNAQVKLAEARADIDRLRNGGLANVATQEAGINRMSLINDAEGAIGDVLETTKADPTMQARSQLARGDLYLTLCEFPELPGAATQPTVLGLPRTSDEYGKLAEDAYNQVLRIPEAPSLTRISARMGLAAIAQNLGDLESARKWYNAVADDPEAGPLKEYALACVQDSYASTQPALLAVDLPPPAPATEPAKNPVDVIPPIYGPMSPFMPGVTQPPDITAPPTSAPSPGLTPSSIPRAPAATQPATKPG